MIPRLQTERFYIFLNNLIKSDSLNVWWDLSVNKCNIPEFIADWSLASGSEVRGHLGLIVSSYEPIMNPHTFLPEIKPYIE